MAVIPVGNMVSCSYGCVIHSGTYQTGLVLYANMYNGHVKAVPPKLNLPT